MSPYTRPKLPRRNFLLAAGSVVGTTLVSAPATAIEIGAQGGRDDRAEPARYHETEHVKTFYRVNRY